MLLRDWLKNKGETLVWLSSEVGCSYPTVQRHASGEFLPKPDHVDAYHRITDGDVRYEDHVTAHRLYKTREIINELRKKNGEEPKPMEAPV